MAETIKVMVNDMELSLPQELFTQGIEKKEIVIKNEDLLIFKKDDYETRLKNERDIEYKKGRKDGVEIEWKETKRKLGLEVEGKNGDEILSAFKEKILAEHKIEPNKALEENKEIIKQLRANLKKADDEKEQLKNDFTTKQKEAELISFLHSSIPDEAVTNELSRKDIMALFTANGYAVIEQDNKKVVTLNGEVVKNPTTLETISVKEVLKNFVVSKNLIKKEDGRNLSDEPNPSKPGTMEAFQKEMDGKSIKYGTPEYVAAMTERIKNKTLIV